MSEHDDILAKIAEGLDIPPEVAAKWEEHGRAWQSLGQTLNEAVAAEWRVRCEWLEALLADAVVLQDFDRLDHLTVLSFPDGSVTVASMLEQV